jgi:hypothetical protein
MKTIQKTINLALFLFLLFTFFSCENEPAEITKATVRPSSELFKLMVNTSTMGDNPYENQVCVDFIYPFAIMVYDSNLNPIQTLTMYNDSQLSNLLINLPMNQSVSISYPIETVNAAGVVQSINNDNELIVALRSCSNENIQQQFAQGFCNPSRSVTIVPYLPNEPNNDYAGAKLFSNPDRTIKMIHLNQVYTGTWIYLYANFQMYLNINFAGNSQVTQDWNHNYKVISSNPMQLVIEHNNTRYTIIKEINPVTPYSIGDPGPHLGIIGYDQGDFIDGWQYIEADTNDLAIEEWGCINSNVPNAQFDNLGSGYQNTVGIANFHMALANYALNPLVCSTANNGTVSAYTALTQIIDSKRDWCIPSIEELQKLYLNLHLNNLGNFSNTLYWSSTDAGGTKAKCLDFSNGNIVLVDKNTAGVKTRMIRYF